MRVNRYIADTGHCSRREADRLIAEGRVTVGGLRARIGAELPEGAEVRVDGNVLSARTAARGQRRHVYIALNKPVGNTCTTQGSGTGKIVRASAFKRINEVLGPPVRSDADAESLQGRIRCVWRFFDLGGFGRCECIHGGQSFHEPSSEAASLSRSAAASACPRLASATRTTSPMTSTAGLLQPAAAEVMVPRSATVVRCPGR